MTEIRSIDGPLKIISNLYLILPTGNNSERGTITQPTGGMIRYNSETDRVEYFKWSRNRWLNFAEKEELESGLNFKVNRTGDVMTGTLYMDANIIPLSSDTKYLGQTDKRWKNIYATVITADEIISHKFSGNSATSSKWDHTLNIDIIGDSQGRLTFDGSTDTVVSISNTTATRWRNPTTLTLSGDVITINQNFDGETNRNLNYNLEVTRATSWRNSVNLRATGNAKFSNFTDPWNANVSNPGMSLPLSGNEGTLDLPIIITSIPNSILKDHYVWKHGDYMDGPLVMKDAAIYSDFGDDLILNARNDLLLTASYNGGVYIQSNDNGINATTSGNINLSSNVVLVNGVGGLKIPSGSTAQRPSTDLLESGMMRWNSKINRVEIWINSQYADPDPDIGGVSSTAPLGLGGVTSEPTLPDGDPRKTGWSAFITEEDLRQRPTYGVVPIGGIIMWSGTHVPDGGWVLCDGTTHNGIVTPDLRDRFIVGAGSSYIVGSTGGSSQVTLTVDQLPSHSHMAPTSVHNEYDSNGSYEVPPVYSPGVNWTDTAYDYINAAPVSTTGNNFPHENRPPYYALAYIMYVGIN